MNEVPGLSIYARHSIQHYYYTDIAKTNADQRLTGLGYRLKVAFKNFACKISQHFCKFKLRLPFFWGRIIIAVVFGDRKFFKMQMLISGQEEKWWQCATDWLATLWIKIYCNFNWNSKKSADSTDNYLPAPFQLHDLVAGGSQPFLSDFCCCRACKVLQHASFW